MTEADYERALRLLQVAEKDLADYVIEFGGNDRLLGVCHALVEAMCLLKVEFLEVEK